MNRIALALCLHAALAACGAPPEDPDAGDAAEDAAAPGDSGPREDSGATSGPRFIRVVDSSGDAVGERAGVDIDYIELSSPRGDRPAQLVTGSAQVDNAMGAVSEPPATGDRCGDYASLGGDGEVIVEFGVVFQPGDGLFVRELSAVTCPESGDDDRAFRVDMAQAREGPWQEVQRCTSGDCSFSLPL